jgi:hypothetical protein
MVRRCARSGRYPATLRARPTSTDEQFPSLPDEIGPLGGLGATLGRRYRRAGGRVNRKRVGVRLVPPGPQALRTSADGDELKDSGAENAKP